MRARIRIPQLAQFCGFCWNEPERSRSTRGAADLPNAWCSRRVCASVLVERLPWLYAVIVSAARENEARAAVREWLRNERRLGVPHYGISPNSIAEACPPGAQAESQTDADNVGSSQGRVPVAARESTSGTTRSHPGASIEKAAAAAPAGRQSGVRPASSPAARSEPLQAGPLEAGLDGLAGPCDRELPEEQARRALAQLEEGYVRGCRKCVLCEGRTQTVFGVGRARPEIVFVGEGPGADEDRVGEPFVGRAGQLLTRMIAAMTLTRDQVYICNTVKCRPPDNRTPTEDEMKTCSPFLYRQLAILRPRVIVALGRPASQSLLATTESISRLRGRFHDFPPPPLANLGLPSAALMPTFHPAYLLRSPNEKSKAWDDLKQVMEYLGIPLPRGR